MSRWIWTIADVLIIANVVGFTIVACWAAVNLVRSYRLRIPFWENIPLVVLDMAVVVAWAFYWEATRGV